MLFAQVLLDIETKQLNRLFDYKIPEEFLEDIEIGMRVLVPFGEQKRLGFVININEQTNYEFEVKNIIDILDVVPTINEESFAYIKYLMETNNILLLEAVKTVIPNSIFFEYNQVLVANNISKLDDKIRPFFNKEGRAIYSNLLKDNKRLINRYIKDGTLKLIKESRTRAKEKLVQTIVYKDSSHYRNRVNYQELIYYVEKNPNLTRKELTDLGFNLSSINTLIKNEVFFVEEIRVNRNLTFKDAFKVKEHILNKEQEDAYNKIKSKLNSKSTILLNGITGSGKTEVYMHVMKEVLNINQNVLYLVPEISLVPQTVNYLKSRFNHDIVHYNSSLSKGERYDAWSKIQENDARIIVGTRSSSFLPISDLGIIIVDEEHDDSYNQESSVQYDLINILNIKSSFHNAPIILGSATPKINSMYLAEQGIYKYTELTKRATNLPLPKVTFVDMKKELKNGNTKIFSDLLLNKINQTLEKGEQIILLYNRKGYSSFILCRDCGHVPKCPSCDISLTYYKESNTLNCSYCNYKKEYIQKCESCNSNKIGPLGLGVDQVYEIVKNEFKDARVTKMDQTSMRRKGSHEKAWLDFRNHKYDILVGTKMVSKGLDFTKVSLVGILMADTELKSPTFFSEEQTYSLLTQMSGRSGRGLLGETIIQGYDLENYAIKSVQRPYKDFYKKALFDREVKMYEPFYKVIQIMIENESYLKSYQDALNIKKILSEKYDFVLGPSEPVIKYVRNLYRFTITVKSKEISYQEVFKVIDLFSESKISVFNTPKII